MFKDKPISAPFRILRPSWFAVPEHLPLGWAASWLLLVHSIAWFEPVPDELNIQFDWKYLAMMHLCALAGQLFLPFLAWKLAPKDIAGGRSAALLRLSAGASLWYLWTFPLAFLFTGSLGSIVLAFGRELLWAGSLAWGAISLAKSSNRIRNATIGITLTVALFLGGILFALIPDASNLARMNMDNIQTGRIGAGIPPLPPNRVDTATWSISGSPELVSAARLSLGDRQKILAASPGQIRVLVVDGPAPQPEDTTGLLEPDPAAGIELESLVALVPPVGSDTLRLGTLHAVVHRSIRYTRRYFPGTTREILQRRTGDCKAYAQVFCAGARRLGYPARVVHGLLASNDGYYAHAWVTVRTSQGWEDWDPTSSYPFPDARYLRFAPPKVASGALDGELAIFALNSISVAPGVGGSF